MLPSVSQCSSNDISTHMHSIKINSIVQMLSNIHLNIISSIVLICGKKLLNMLNEIIYGVELTLSSFNYAFSASFQEKITLSLNLFWTKETEMVLPKGILIAGLNTKDTIMKSILYQSWKIFCWLMKARSVYYLCIKYCYSCVI